MINNKVFPNLILPNPQRTDVRNHNNFCYNPGPPQAPTNTNVVPPAHTTPSSNTFAGSSSSSKQSTIDDVLYEIRAQNAISEECDGLFYAMYQQQEEMMEQMHLLQAQQTKMLHNQHEMQGYYNRWESAEARRQQQLDRVVQELGNLRLHFDDFQQHQQPPHD
ncbi:hypothetical protein L195_g018683 [Trifolium pratense]|uniref:Uncharacterized protein n=1 Tax=Trifolium pratense TaxID=57577 RepID=A0A2K3MXG3_TRIPR|nr:hypothetical protein L195_g018683 [Trifolium pratense]